MLFYKIQGVMTDSQTNEGEKKEKRNFIRRTTINSENFNSKKKDSYCFVSNVDDNIVTVGLIAKGFLKPVQFVKEYSAFVGFDIDNIVVNEVTLNTLQSMLSIADRQGYIEDEDDVLEKFGLDKISGRLGRGIEFGESLVDEGCTKNELVRNAVKYLMRETLVPELDRIFAERKSQQIHVQGHPVHYMIETDNRDTRREVYKIILSALRANMRLDSKRYAFLNFHPGKKYSLMAYETLYEVCEGGAVVVRYLANDDTEEGDSATGELDTIENICRMAKNHRNKVLTIICLPRECKKAKSLFYEHLGAMAFVEIREDFVNGVDAKQFLCALAKDNHIRTDQRLFAKLEPDKRYLATELQELFEEWYNAKLRSTIYPQYRNIAVARQEAVTSAPKGSAYDELMAMIGLNEAKEVIQKALNYYKMQELYEEKGVKRDHPAMHMVFSGNPGTAKTTVARLFARIMRENRLVSKGQLVEVGRGDLVGKYVGWTAPTIQAKFTAASGGVLFIDEAYSLVDDRDGSYGDEAINTIVQEMENHRADVVVIFAGYPDKMERFLQKNPGLRSRIAFHVPFADYSSSELCQIARLMGKKNGMRINDAAVAKLETVFDTARSQCDFGNGRYVRNVFEQAKMNQASRLLKLDFDSITAEDVSTITEDDIAIPTLKQTEERRIGFC